jgi:hypothetical protein
LARGFAAARAAEMEMWAEAEEEVAAVVEEVVMA